MKKYAVVDVETTGGSFKLDKVIEIGIVLIDGDKISNQFQSLIHPERSIPYQITALTGINNQMIENAPRFYEIAKHIVELTQDRIFVAHNARFDYNFLKAEFEELGFVFTRKILDTVKLSRLAFPGYKSYSLSSLIQIFNIQINDRHRALDDALATAEIFQKILQSGNFVGTSDDYIKMAIKESFLPPNVSVQDIIDIPAEEGVYYFYNEENLLYVGKSKNLKSRISQHFSDHSQKSSTLRQSTTRIDYEIQPNELFALLKESIEIKTKKPIYNKALRNTAFPYVLCYEIKLDNIINFRSEQTKLLSAQERVLKYFTHRKFADYYLTSFYERLLQFFEELEISETERDQIINLHSGLIPCPPANLITLYNHLVISYIEQIRPVFDNDMIILDISHKSDNIPAVLIYQHKFFGYGLLDKNQAIENTNQLIESIHPAPYFPDLDLIINGYIKKYSHKFKIIQLNNLQ